ncbi:MAG: hypothetical protein HC933_21855 [Pleurocapsa sp. SU_196_0]|nr:hypothetical protein [Pleurocapsa sp. SU_196_0]
MVVAYALAGTVIKDVYLHPIGQDKEGNDVFLKDIWASLDEVKEHLEAAFDAETYKKLYSEFAEDNPLWNSIPSTVGQVYEWDRDSTYIQEPPFFEDFSMETGSFSDIKGARALAIFGDSVTTDHISPAGPWLRYRGHLDKFSDNMFMGATNAWTGETGKGRNVLTGQTGQSIAQPWNLDVLIQTRLGFGDRNDQQVLLAQLVAHCLGAFRLHRGEDHLARRVPHLVGEYRHALPPLSLNYSPRVGR